MKPDMFYEMLNHIGLGTGILIILAITAVGNSLYKSGIKIYESIKKRVLKQQASETKETTIEESIANLSSTVGDLKNSIDDVFQMQDKRDEEYANRLKSIEEKIDKEQASARESEQGLSDRLDKYTSQLDLLARSMQRVEKKQTLLIESDKETIRSYITDTYFSAKEDGFIPYHKMQNVDSMYKKYLEENGDSFVEHLMMDLRKLPSTKPEDGNTVIE